MTLIPNVPLEYRSGELYLDNCSLQAIAREYGTPCFVYSRNHIEQQYLSYYKAFGEMDHLICYGVKANSNVSILKLLGELGSGVDLVSGGELERAKQAGIPPDRMIFSGVAKTDEELRMAIRTGILMINVESQQELWSVSRIAQEENRTAGISIRINPHIDAGTHPYISTGLAESKFGIPAEETLEMYQEASTLPGIEIRGLQSHIGSQITDLSVFSEVLDKLVEMMQMLKSEGFPISYLDLGGGLGIAYRREEKVAEPRELIDSLHNRLSPLGVTVIIEPGRSIVGNAGVLLTRVIYYKENRQKKFAIVDSTMSELLRPALYQAYHEVVPVIDTDRESKLVDVAGAVCESADILARDRMLPHPQPGDLYAVLSVGAYGFCMASHYNSRPRPAEILVEGDSFRIIRRRENFQDLIAPEKI